MLFKGELNHLQKIKLSEVIYLFLLVVFIPFLVGIEIWGYLPFTLSLVMLNILQLPSIVLFYRIVLPRTILKNRILQFVLALPVYLLIYELNSRLASITIIHTPFIPEGYKNLLRPEHPEMFNFRFNQSLGYTGLVLLTASALALIRERYKQQQQFFEVSLEKIKLELEHLKSQVQPHFFFNTLNNLYALSIQKSDKAPVMIASLSSIMRYVLYESQRSTIGLDKELSFIENYVALEQLRHSDSRAIDLLVQGNAGPHSVPPLLFLPLIENCFKHAFKNADSNESVKIIFAIDEDEVTFQTSNKKSMVPKDPSYQGGIGLNNVKKRLELLYPDRHNLFIEETDDRFELVLTLAMK